MSDRKARNVKFMLDSAMMSRVKLKTRHETEISRMSSSKMTRDDDTETLKQKGKVSTLPAKDEEEPVSKYSFLFKLCLMNARLQIFKKKVDT